MINQKIIAIATWIAALLLVPLSLIDLFEGDSTLLIGIIAFGLLLYVFFALKDNASALPLLGLFFIGKFNFLPFSLTASIIFSAALIAYYFFAYFALQRRGLSFTPFQLTIPILVLALIVLYHNRQVGLHSLGTNLEGSRPGLLMLLSTVAFFCGISVSTPSSSFLRWLPLYCTLLLVLASIPGVITTFFPDLTPYFYFFTDAINLDAYFDIHGMDTDLVRFGALASIGLTILTFLLAYYPVNTWWRPRRWWVFFLSLLGIGFILSGGFRGDLIIFGFTLLLSIWCYHSWRALLIFPLLALLGIGINLCLHSNLIDLPLNAQRSLSFLPGNWNSSATESASASNDFRRNIQDVYIREELHKSPWLGNGFIFDTEEYTSLLLMSRNAETPDHYYQSKAFITGKLFHIGWISLFDTVGLVGSAAFLILACAMIKQSARLVSHQADRASPLFPLKVWLFCIITRDMIAFFTVFGDFRTSFTEMCAYAIILVQINRLESTWEKVTAPSLQAHESPLNSGTVPEPFLPAS